MLKVPEPNSLPTVVGVIPARLASTRLPGKVLLPLAGRPMLAWVVEAARACTALTEVVVATDSPEVMTLAREQGWVAMLTSPELPSGSDRVHAVAQRVPAEIYVNLQGDEPLLRPEHVEALLAPFRGDAGQSVAVTTLCTVCPPNEVADPNVVKVVTALDGRALFFSRAPIPFHRDGISGSPYRKHLGLYAYRREALHRFAALPPTPLEQTERLEQLRMLENGMAIYVEHTAFETVGVDTAADLLRAEALLLRRLAGG